MTKRCNKKHKRAFFRRRHHTKGEVEGTIVRDSSGIGRWAHVNKGNGAGFQRAQERMQRHQGR